MRAGRIGRRSAKDVNYPSISVMSLASEVLPSHLEPLVPSQWAIWRWFVLRGAGFPAALAERLAQPACASAADELIQAEDILEERFQQAIRSFNSALDQFASEGMDREDERFKAVLRARRRLADRKIPETSGLPQQLAAKLPPITLALNERDRLRPQWEDRFTQCIASQSDALQAFAADARFQEAVIWQNRQAFETAVQPAARGLKPYTRNQRQRNHEQLIARYAQRYCVKNDSIGFFGPVVWGQIGQGERIFEMLPGPALTNKRQTYFEAWAIHRCAASLSLLEGMDWWIPPRLAPDVSMEKGLLLRPGVLPLKLTELEQATLALCNGKNLPDEILRGIREDARFHSVSEQELRDVLRAKSAAGILAWRLMVPVEANPEINLRQQLSRIGDSRLRTAAMGCLEKLEAARNQVSNAAGHPTELNEAIQKAELVFEEITKTPGHRNPGATYAARSILYEDCRRDLALQLSPGLLDPIVPALSLLLKSLRWFVQATALEFHRLFRETYRELAAREPEGEIRLLAWWMYTEPRLLQAPSISEIEKFFKQKWRDLLPVGPGNSILQLNSGELKKEVDHFFPDPGPGYYSVRYFCPDLMLAAKDAEAIRRGDVLYVLGEVHAGKNTLCHTALVEQHPDAQELVAATQWDLSTTCFKIITPQEAETTTVRTSEAALRPQDFLVATTPDSIAPSGHDSHSIGELVLREQDGELCAVDLHQGRRFHVLEAFSDLLFGFVMNKASWVQPAGHVPRILIDNLVVHRESWRFRRNELAFAAEKDEAKRFLGARTWMKRNGIPRKTFVKSASEVKPFYLDLESPALVEGLCRAVHHMKSSPADAEELTFSEMLPGAGQLWLRDAAGDSYTSELRFAVVDLQARSWSELQRKTRG
jgi:hypothetical protein